MMRSEKDLEKVAACLQVLVTTHIRKNHLTSLDQCDATNAAIYGMYMGVLYALGDPAKEIDALISTLSD